jgi:hypothetical protein
MGCTDAIRLERTLAQALAIFEEAQRQIQSRLGVLPRAEYFALSRDVDRAWAAVQRARTALDKHFREHPCRAATA